MKKVSVYGVGKAGLPLVAVIAESGLSVIGVCRNKKKASEINQGYNPIPEETGLSNLLKKHASKRIFITTDGVKASRETQIHIIIVPLFIDKDKKPDFTNIKDASKKIALGLKKGDLVILETTAPVETTRNLIKKILEKYSNLKAGSDFYLAVSPERMMTGYAISRYKEFPKIVGGINMESTKKAADFYREFCQRVIEVKDLETAEMTKIAEGVFRDVNIALANELFKVCQQYNVDFWEVRKAASHDFCNIHEPGNVGGHCIPVYPWFLINNLNVPLIKIARIINDEMIEYYVNQAKKIAKKKGLVLIIGISFREGVKEIAYSRGFSLIKLLEKEGYQVFVYDPLYSKKEIKNFSLKYSDDFDKADCIILMNKYPALKNKLSKNKNKIIDVKNCLNT